MVTPEARGEVSFAELLRAGPAMRTTIWITSKRRWEESAWWKFSRA